MAVTVHKIRMYPTPKQEVYFRRACGTARFTYNWGIDLARQWYAEGKKWSVYDAVKHLNAIKREQFPWMLEVTKCAGQYALWDLDAAFKRFFKHKAKHPKYKHRSCRSSFYLEQGTLKSYGGSRSFSVPRLGTVKLAESLRFSGKIMNAVISREADYWFVSISVEVPDVEPPVHKNRDKAVGVDLGVSVFATLSTGEKIHGPNALKKRLGRLRRAQRKLSRRKKGSGRRERARREVARIHYRVRCVRQDFLHKLTTRLCRGYGIIVIEDLCVRGMIRCRRLARTILDQGWGDFRRQLEYKSAVAGSRLFVADRFYPSSKTCSSCGHVLSELHLKVREWTCPMCGQVHDRDLNAALNLRNLAGNSPVTARGAEVRPASYGASAMKREFSRKGEGIESAAV